MAKVTDAALLSQLNGEGGGVNSPSTPVTDPKVQNQLNQVSPGPMGVNLIGNEFNKAIAGAADFPLQIPAMAGNVVHGLSSGAKAMGLPEIPGFKAGEYSDLPTPFLHLAEQAGFVKDIIPEDHEQKLMAGFGNILGQATGAVLGSEVGTSMNNLGRKVLTGPLQSYTTGQVKRLADVANGYGIQIQAGHMLRPGAGARSLQVIEGSLGNVARDNQRMLEKNILNHLGERGDYITEDVVKKAEQNISADYDRWLMNNQILNLDSSSKPHIEQLLKIQKQKISGIPNAKLEKTLGSIMKQIPVNPGQGVAVYKIDSRSYKDLMSDLNREISSARGRDDNLARLYSEAKIEIQKNIESHLPPEQAVRLHELDSRWNMLGYVKNSGISGWGISPNKFSKAVENYMGESRWSDKAFGGNTAYDLAKTIRTFPHAFANNIADTEIPSVGKSILSGAGKVASKVGGSKIVGSKTVQSLLLNKKPPLETPMTPMAKAFGETAPAQAVGRFSDSVTSGIRKLLGGD